MPQIILDITDEQIAQFKSEVEKDDPGIVIKEPLKLLEILFNRELNDLEDYVDSYTRDEGGNDILDSITHEQFAECAVNTRVP